MTFKRDTHFTALFTVDAFQMADEWEATPVSEVDEQVTAEIVMAIAADDVRALEAAAQQLPALNVSFFDITVLLDDIPNAKPVSLLRLAQRLNSGKAWAFIISEGLSLENAECVAAVSEWLGAAALSQQKNAHRPALQEANLDGFFRPESFEDIFEMLDCVADIEASIGEPCQLRSTCMQLCREFMQARDYDFHVDLDSYGRTVH